MKKLMVVVLAIAALHISSSKAEANGHRDFRTFRVRAPFVNVDFGRRHYHYRSFRSFGSYHYGGSNFLGFSGYCGGGGGDGVTRSEIRQLREELREERIKSEVRSEIANLKLELREAFRFGK